jgi:hypothetical protein
MVKTIHVVSILDRSGSMQGTENEVIGAYNNFIEEQKKLAKEKKVTIKTTLVLFDNLYEEVYSEVPVAQTPELTSEVYFTRGMTAYYDAVGRTIAKLDKKKNVIFFIETDGYENSSKEYNLLQIRDLVKKKTEEGWDFNFVGADLDAATTKQMSGLMGIDPTKAFGFSKSAEGYATRNQSFVATASLYIDTKVRDSSSE